MKDEFFTPRILVEPIIKYLKPGSVVWCPFDTENSEYALVLREHGYEVITSHLWDGEDFLTYEPEERYDYIISCPPPSIKIKVLQRLYDLDMPFAMLMNIAILNYEEVNNFFVDKKLELLIINKRVSFTGKHTSFNHSYFCKDVLPKDKMNIFENVEHCNERDKYVPSRMLEDYVNKQQESEEAND